MQASLLFRPTWLEIRAAMLKFKPARKTLPFFLIPLIGTLVGQTTAILAAGYQVDGHILRGYTTPNGSQGTASNWFQVKVDRCSTTITAGPINDPVIEFFQHCFDGKNSSLLVKYVAQSPLKVANEATLMLNSGPVPEYGYGMISEVWLAYASACFYQRLANGHSPPVFDMGGGFRESHQMVKSDWRLTKTAPPLLDYMRDFADGFRYSEEDGKLLKQQLPSPFNRGYTNSIYSVILWTNHAGLTLPLQWRVVQYRPNLVTGRLEPITTHGFTTAISMEGYASDFSPHMPKNTRIIDNTLEAQGSPVHTYAYMTTNGQIRTLAQLEQETDFIFALQDAPPAPKRPAKRLLIALVVFVLILFPSIFFAWKYRPGKS